MSEWVSFRAYLFVVPLRCIYIYNLGRRGGRKTVLPGGRQIAREIADGRKTGE